MKYEVIIKASVIKTYTVDAANEDEAEATATDLFSVLEDGALEDYDQKVLEVVLLEEEKQ
jgi:hypothetical protein